MKIVQVQVEPHPIFEVREFTGRPDFNDLLHWLNTPDLPETLSLSLSGCLYAFHTRLDRYWFALGFSKAWDIVDDEDPR